MLIKFSTLKKSVRPSTDYAKSKMADYIKQTSISLCVFISFDFPIGRTLSEIRYCQQKVTQRTFL